MKNILIIYLTAGLFALNLSLTAAVETDPSTLFKEANSLFEQANETALKDPLKSRDLYRKAALKYQFIISELGVVTPVLLMDLGNAYYLAGDTGRGLLNYYRAAQLDPLNDDIQHNLKFLRSKCVDELDETFWDKVMEKIFFWHYFSFKTRIILFAISYILMWCFVAVLLFKNKKYIRVAIYAMAVVSVIMGTSIAVSSMELFSPVDGIITSKEAQAYQGNSYIYNPAFLTPLHAGTEFKLKEKRGDWYYISLANGSSCWIPAKDVELLGDY